MPATSQPSSSGDSPMLARLAVRDVMHEGLVACEADASVTELARLMAMHRIHCILVRGTSYDASGAERVWGIVSDFDLLRAGVRTDGTRPAGTIAHTPMFMVDASAPIAEAAELMLVHGVSHLVVVESADPTPVGVVSTIDIAAGLADCFTL